VKSYINKVCHVPERFCEIFATQCMLYSASFILLNGVLEVMFLLIRWSTSCFISRTSVDLTCDAWKPFLDTNSVVVLLSPLIAHDVHLLCCALLCYCFFPPVFPVSEEEEEEEIGWAAAGDSHTHTHTHTQAGVFALAPKWANEQF